MTEHPPIQIVDEDDQPVRGGSMEEIHANGLLHRIVVVIVQDTDGRMLLQLRSPKVSTNKNHWDASAAGHVDEGEDYLTAAKRELEEEIGLKGVDLKEVAYFRSEVTHGWRHLNRFRRVYLTVVPPDTKFEINPEEITEVKWLKPDELRDLIKNHPDEVVGDFVDLLDKLGL